jgi:hypothetical protein
MTSIDAANGFFIEQSNEAANGHGAHLWLPQLSEAHFVMISPVNEGSVGN